jgi:hypothetical protein
MHGLELLHGLGGDRAETSLPRWPWRSVFVVATAWRASSAPTMRLPAVR